ncbi:hypothetical protein Tco_0045381 [Tanacetum coccineum]
MPSPTTATDGWMLSYVSKFWAIRRVEIASNLKLQIKEAQRDDGELRAICSIMLKTALRDKVMTGAHSFSIYIHPAGSTKSNRDLKQYFGGMAMKPDVATFVSKCMTSSAEDKNGDWYRHQGVKRFGIRAKLIPEFIGPLRFWNVLERFRIRLALPSAVIAMFMMLS